MTPEPQERLKADTMDEIRNAFRAIWRGATNQPEYPGDRALMTIPPDKKRDADFIMHRAMDELEAYRNRSTAMLDEVLAEFASVRHDAPLSIKALKQIIERKKNNEL